MSQFWSKQLSGTSNKQVSYAVEIFRSDMLQHAPAGSSAYPPTRSQTYFPLALTFEWTSSGDDQTMANTATQSVQQLNKVASAEGQDISTVPVYGNYAGSHTWTSDRIFGDNLSKLQSLKKQYDPNNVMSLTGGWKI